MKKEKIVRESELEREKERERVDESLSENEDTTFLLSIFGSSAEAVNSKYHHRDGFFWSNVIFCLNDK